MSATAEVQSGLEGVVAFATEIAEPDREGGALRYRGVDIEELVGKVPFEQVWGLLVDGKLLPGHAAGRAASAERPLRRPARRRAVGAGDAGAAVGLRPADRHLRRGGARQPGARLGDGAVVRRPVGPRDRPARPCPSARSTRRRAIAERFLIRWRGEADPRHVRGDRRLLDLGRRARDERLDVHRPGRRLDRRRRRRRAVGRGGRAVGAAARRRPVPRAEDARRRRARWATPTATSRTCSIAASG